MRSSSQERNNSWSEDEDQEKLRESRGISRCGRGCAGSNAGAGRERVGPAVLANHRVLWRRWRWQGDAGSAPGRPVHRRAGRLGVLHGGNRGARCSLWRTAGCPGQHLAGCGVGLPSGWCAESGQLRQQRRGGKCPGVPRCIRQPGPQFLQAPGSVWPDTGGALDRRVGPHPLQQGDRQPQQHPAHRRNPLATAPRARPHARPAQPAGAGGLLHRDQQRGLYRRPGRRRPGEPARLHLR
jgi:hypothetical protein